MPLKTFARLALIPVLAIALSACQATTDGTLVSAAPAAQEASDVNAFLRVPPAPVNHDRAGETPVSLLSIRDRVLAENPSAFSMEIVGVPGRSGIAFGLDGRIYFTSKPFSAKRTLSFDNPVAFSAGHQVCTSTEMDVRGRWNGLCVYGYQRADGEVRVVIEGNRSRRKWEDFSGIPAAWYRN
jgi:hypothetical protein